MVPRLGISAVLCLALCAPGRANDSQAEMGLGGLTLVRSESVTMASEELRISDGRIEVDYVFLNTGTQDVDTLVAFPLPDFENTEHSPEVRIPDYVGELDFRTTIDGKPAPLTLVQTATFGGVDVTAHLKALKLPIMPSWQPLQDAMKALPQATRAELAAAGWVEDANGGAEGIDPDWIGLWKVSTSVTRRQVFPARRPVAVSHAYRPFAGGSVGGRLDPQYRDEDFFREAVAKYCMDEAFLRGLDKRIRTTDQGRNYSEKWISYVLVSGANWKGPIGRFRMVIDKGAAGNMVSFCADGVRKIDDRRFEVVKENHTPKQNVDVLVVDFTTR